MSDSMVIHATGDWIHMFGGEWIDMIHVSLSPETFLLCFQLLYPLLRLRQACCHPQAVRGEFLPIHKWYELHYNNNKLYLFTLTIEETLFKGVYIRSTLVSIVAKRLLVIQTKNIMNDKLKNC